MRSTFDNLSYKLVYGDKDICDILKEYRRNVYLDLLMSGRLNSYLADIEEQAQERFERADRPDEAGTGKLRSS